VAENPYAPPAAKVSDVDAGEPLPRPRAVTRAIQLFWISFVLTLLFVFVGDDLLPGSGDTESIAAVVIGFIFALAVLAFLIRVVVQIGRAKSWARVAYVILAVLGWLLSLSDLPGMFSQPWYSWSWDLASAAIDVAIVVLLYSPAANAWFRARGVVSVRFLS
jgi:hypothetical protein